MSLAGFGTPVINHERQPSLVKIIKALRSGRVAPGTLEREISDATAELTGAGPSETAYYLPLAGLTYAQVLKETGIRTPSSDLAVRALGEGASSLTTTQGGGGLAGFQTLSDDFALAMSSSIVLANMPEVSVVPTLTKAGVVPSETTIATTGAVAENSVLTSSDPVLAALPFTNQKVTATRLFSSELFNDIPNPNAFLQRILSRDVGLAADLGYLEGSGAGANIKGIRNTAGLTTSSWVAATNGSTPGGDDIVNMAFDIPAANGTTTGFVMHPRTAKKIALLKDAQGRYLFPDIMTPPPWYTGSLAAPRPGGMIYGARVYLTTSVGITDTQGSSSAATHIIYGDFSRAVVTVRASVELQVVRPEDAMQLKLSAHTFLNIDQELIVATLRTSIVLAQPTAFALATGIL